MKKKLTLTEEVFRMKKMMGLLNENEMMGDEPTDLFGSGGSFPTEESEGFKQWCDENGIVEVGPDMYTMGDDREYTKDEMMQMYSDSEYAATGVDSDVDRDIERGHASDEPMMFEDDGMDEDLKKFKPGATTNEVWNVLTRIWKDWGKNDTDVGAELWEWATAWLDTEKADMPLPKMAIESINEILERYDMIDEWDEDSDMLREYDEDAFFDSGRYGDYPSDFDHEGDATAYSSGFFDDEVEEFDDEKFNNWLMDDKNAVEIGRGQFRVDGETYTEEQLMDMFTKEMKELYMDDPDATAPYEYYPDDDEADLYEQKKRKINKGSL